MGNITDIFHVSPFRPYVSDSRSAQELLPHIKFERKEEYKRKGILHSAYCYNLFYYLVEYKGTQLKRANGCKQKTSGKQTTWSGIYMLRTLISLSFPAGVHTDSPM